MLASHVLTLGHYSYVELCGKQARLTGSPRLLITPTKLSKMLKTLNTKNARGTINNIYKAIF